MNAAVALLFFLSGASGLIYEVTWARSLGLVFGASHLAVATVLAVYMGGQALGSVIFGPRADRSARPLRLYGLLELGAGLSALAFLALLAAYPRLYPPIARLGAESALYLSAVRGLFAVAAMIVPTTLLGGTLPALTRLLSRRGSDLARPLARLYAVNTAGAVAGALAAGFLLLPRVGVTATLLAGVAVSFAVGAAALLLQRRAASGQASPEGAGEGAGPAPGGEGQGQVARLAGRLTVLGIAASGFCALGYEVLWTRMLSFVVGTSVYSFTLILAAFLAGIGAGSQAFALLRRRVGSGRSAVLAFGAIQVLVGLSALAVTAAMRELPGIAFRLRSLLAWQGATEFGARLATSGAVSVAFMFVPAFFMGLSFPAAGAVRAAGERPAGETVGGLLAANTLGAILGTLVSGFALIHLLGIERSLQVLVLVDVGTGLAVAASVARRRWILAAATAVPAVLLAARVAWPGWGRTWDEQDFAAYLNNLSPDELAEHRSAVEVVYFKEGINETVSVTRAGGELSFVVNGRAEASTAPTDLQLQKALGHIPMLLHPNPRRVFVLGSGAGMTLGATSLHPGVERLVLAEIERGVLGATRTFGPWNAHVLDDPRLRVVIDDGRSFLATTRERFDVITADPIHPWSGGAGYLYTVEYFRSAAARLAPGGIVSQWLPLYELSVGDLRTVVRSFAEAFRHVQLWLTFYDAVLVGSNDPILLDEAALARRMEVPAVRDDLARARMGSVGGLLSSFLAGDAGARAFAAGGDLNTDDGVALEFSAPRSQGVRDLGVDMAAVSAVRESLLPYLTPAPEGPARLAQVARWTGRLELGRRYDALHARFLEEQQDDPGLRAELAGIVAEDPGFAPALFLDEEMAFWRRTRFEVVRTADFPAGAGAVRVVAARKYVTRSRALVLFLDGGLKEIYGHRYVDGDDDRLEETLALEVDAAFASLRATAAQVSRKGGAPPREAELADALRREVVRVVGPPPGR
ncbi:MAG TPA: fused MFS/spermidine synthase [Anaeromyxobacter sp.]|nr:fused MFS/spermidine synthase [Anaeromyxobacter sp.]